MDDTLDDPTAPDELGVGDDLDDTWKHPSTLALTAFVLAVLSLLGASVFRGIAYTLPFAPHGFDDDGSKGYVVAGGLLSAAFALLPLQLARTGLGRLVPFDAEWTGHLLRAAGLLAAISVLLHVVLALVALKTPSGASLAALVG